MLRLILLLTLALEALAIQAGSSSPVWEAVPPRPMDPRSPFYSTPLCERLFRLEPIAVPIQAGICPPSRAADPVHVISDGLAFSELNDSLWQISGIRPNTIGPAMEMQLTDGQYSIMTTRDHLGSTENDIVASVAFTYSAGGIFGLQMDLRGNGMAQMAVRDAAEGNVIFYVINKDQIAMTTTTTLPVGSGGYLKLVYHRSSGKIEGLIWVNETQGWVSVGDSAGISLDVSQGMAFQILGVANPSETFSPSFRNFLATGDLYLPPELGQKGVVLERVTYLSRAVQRDFRMAVPASYDPNRPIGILFGFHGNLGSYPNIEPFLSYLFYTGLEAETERGYFLAVSLSVPKAPNGWLGAWNHEELGSGLNNDTAAVQNLVLFLKKYYAIDDDRIFATGFSDGGRFVTDLPNALPDFIAAIAPICPAYGRSLPLPGARHACIGVGGITDEAFTAGVVRQISNWHKTNKTDADCYVFDMGHNSPPDDPTVTPRRPFASIMTDYFLAHPRGYASRPPTPPSYASVFKDDFEGSPTLPSASRWRVSLFDSSGILYGPIKNTGEPGASVFGYKFKIENGALNSESVGAGNQGGICMSGFMPKPSIWKTSFVVNQGDSDLTVWPVILSDMTGRVVSLNVSKTGWEWQAASTHLAFRSRDAASIQSLSGGALTLEIGAEYTARAELSTHGLVWNISSEAGEIARGQFSSARVALGESQFGLGLSGTNASVKFNEAQLDHTNAVEPLAWSYYP